MQKITSEDEYQAIINTIQDGLFVIRDSKIALCNNDFSFMIGVAANDIIGRNIDDLLMPESIEPFKQRHEFILNGGLASDPMEFYLRRLDNGLAVSVLCSISRAEGKDGEVSSVGTVKDISLMQSISNKLIRTEKEYQTTIDNLPDTYYRTDKNGLLTMISAFCITQLGYTQDELLGTDIKQLYQTPADRDRIVDALRQGKGNAEQVEAAMMHKDGRVMWISTNAFMRYDDQGDFIGIEGVARNISERKHMEDALRRQATHDPLTNIFNRAGFTSQMEVAIERARRNNKLLSVMYIDLDDFKVINDTLGHKTGDEVLIEFANRLKSITRKMDVIGRIGGDEFVIVFEDEVDREHASAKVQTLEDKLMAPFKPGVDIKCSIGVAIYPEDGVTVSELLSSSDNAMYKTKKDRKL